VIGSGPAGLTYASLVAAGNTVTVFEREPRAGGAFRYAGLAPRFQGVVPSEQSFTNYIDNLVAACEKQGVRFRYETDVLRAPALLQPFDRIVIASGAKYRFGLGGVTRLLLDLGMARWPGLRQIFSRDSFRDWFYYRARRGTAESFKALAGSGQKVVVIGDAVAADKSKAAIASAFEAALLGN